MRAWGQELEQAQGLEWVQRLVKVELIQVVVDRQLLMPRTIRKAGSIYIERLFSSFVIPPVLLTKKGASHSHIGQANFSI